MDPSARLRYGDALLREGNYAGAVAEYEQAANSSLDSGLTVKAVAVLRQIADIIDRWAPQLVEERTRVLRALLGCFTTLGLTSDADAVRQLLN